MNRKIIATALAVALLLILVPQPSQAAPRMWTSLSEPAVSLIAKIGRWWSLFLNGSERPPSPPAWQKQGCGMDPNGQVVCEPGTGTNATEPAPAHSGGN